MNPRAINYLLVGAWLLVAVVVIAYPLRTGKIRVGLDPVSRTSAPMAFWRAYIISTALFLALSVAAGVLVRAILR